MQSAGESSNFPGNGRCEVWCVKTDADDDISRFEAFLSSDEKARAARFRFQHHRENYVLVRGVLRALLARYTGASPANVSLVYGIKGKPSLPLPATLHFNLSHTSGVGIFAFALGCELGVDIERVRPMPDMQEIAWRYFSPAEAAELMALTGEARKRAFFHCWTRKEAYIKAIGEGLSCPLDRFQVTQGPGDSPRIIHIANDPAAASEWTLEDLRVPEDYVAALAYRGLRMQVTVSPLLNPTRMLDLCPA